MAGWTCIEKQRKCSLISVGQCGIIGSKPDGSKIVCGCSLANREVVLQGLQRPTGVVSTVPPQGDIRLAKPRAVFGEKQHTEHKQQYG